MAKIHLDVRKITHPNQLNVKQGHNQRTNANEDWSHIDPTKTYLNHDLVNEANADLRDLVESRIQEASLQAGYYIRKRKDAVIAFSIVLSFTHGAAEGLMYNHQPEGEGELGFEIDDWEQASLEWLKDYFGEDNVVSAMVHLDESNPHIHAIVVPVTEDLRLCAKEWSGSGMLLSKMHQSYGRKMAEPPFNLELPQKHSRAKHHTIQQFYEEMNAVDTLTIPQKEREETLEAYLSRIQEFCRKTELRRISERKYAELQLSQAQAENRELRIEYKQAMNLHQYLSRILGTKENADAELLRLYQLEHIPREELDRLLKQYESQYTIEGYLTMTK